MTAPPLPVRRAAALLLLAVPAALAWLLLAPWLDAGNALSERIDNALAREARARGVVERGAALAAEDEALRGVLADVTELPAGRSYAVVGAELQRRVRDAAIRHRGNVQSLETLPEDRAGAGMVGVRARLQIDVNGLQTLLAELEAGRMPFHVQSLTLVTTGTGARWPLDVQLQLHALRREEPRA